VIAGSKVKRKVFDRVNDEMIGIYDFSGIGVCVTFCSCYVIK
jgi:hypothetical protein